MMQGDALRHQGIPIDLGVGRWKVASLVPDARAFIGARLNTLRTDGGWRAQ